MAEFTVQEILTATSGELLTGPFEARVQGVSTDSRTLRRGEAFLALRGEKYDGHDFTGQALAAGASALIVEEKMDFPPGVAVIRVASTLLALGKLAAYHRQRFSVQVIGVTGSNGKTTTKEMIGALLEEKYKVLKSAMNYNNEVGLPLTLLKMKPPTEVVVLEMGMRGEGEIAYLAGLARPTVGVVTNVGVSHMELLGSREAIARAKGELIASLNREGLAVLNADDPYVRAMQGLFPGRSVFYGFEEEAEPDLRAVAVRPAGGGQEVEVAGKWGPFTFFLPLPGRHNVANALAAAATALSFGLSPGQVAAGFKKLPPVDKRLRILETRGITVIDDTYNADPDSVQKALEVLGKMKGRKIAVLGDMLELGEISGQAHRETGNMVADYGCTALFAYGPRSEETVAAAAEAGVFSRHYADKKRLIRDLKNYLAPGDHVLVKGSRGMKMEEIVEELLGEETK